MSDDIHALSGAYAVDALDAVERDHFEQHLALCADCRREVESLQEAAALLAETTVGAPSVALRERVLAGIATVRPLPPIVGEGGEPYVGAHRAEVEPVGQDASVVSLATRRRRRAARFLVAAAAVVAIGTGGVVVHQMNDDKAAPTSVAARVIAAPDHQTYRWTSDNGTVATVYRSPKLHQAVLVTKDFPPAQQGTEYVLWLVHDGTAVPAGVLPRTADSQVLLSGDAATATGAGISVEKAGSNPTTPSDQMVATIPFRET